MHIRAKDGRSSIVKGIVRNSHVYRNRIYFELECVEPAENSLRKYYIDMDITPEYEGCPKNGRIATVKGYMISPSAMHAYSIERIEKQPECPMMPMCRCPEKCHHRG
ncbi:hypothetical protein AGMMS49573_10450 [Endomicrobiia bacterium]|nr:hypothetical protein AGMMS49573_10450 [Endomicrobiia bacterium]